MSIGQSQNPTPADQKVRQDGVDLTITDAIPIDITVLAADGEVLHVNQYALDRFGLSANDVKNQGYLRRTCHPDDLDRVLNERSIKLSKGIPFELEIRLLSKSDEFRWHLAQYNPLVDESGNIIRWYVTATDIDDRKKAEEAVRSSERNLNLMINAIPAMVGVLRADGTLLSTNRMALDYSGLSPQNMAEGEYRVRVYHPADLEKQREERRLAFTRHAPFETEHRLLGKDGQYRWHLTRYNPVLDEQGRIDRWYAVATDIDDRKRAEEELRQSEENLRTITDTIRQPIVVLAPDGTMLYTNRVALGKSGLTVSELKEKGFLARVGHPEDVERVLNERKAGLSKGVPFDSEARVLGKSGEYRWQLFQYDPLKDESGQIIRWYATATDIDDRKRSEEQLRQSEENLRTITDAIRQPISVLAPDGTWLYANRVALDNSGLTLDEVIKEDFFPRIVHPDDINRVRDEHRIGLLEGIPFDLESRLRFQSGQYRWQLIQYNPLKKESGQIIRWYITVTDIDDQKRKEERLRNENLVLREEIDRSSMFEEIVGSSTPMSQLLKKVEKVAPSDSTVLILGETGTGKELIARALHRRSKRANRAFVKVNCAAIPQSLIASELFGHEKGAFTGALQRRVGRFEAANGGTLFLDEIGDLPMETQIALLRVLQEKEFERVGSNHPISVDVRLIAATNRDLPAAVAAGTFRQDLFYRLNVFPIDVPPLRNRAEDIPLLVEYFVGRFAKEAGKNIRHIGKQTLEQLQRCRWPGNIRELQNVVERAVILSDTDIFVVDQSWLESEPEDSSQHEGLSALEDREVEMIEAALVECHGRISGPSGAAAKLGIPRQTLESKIRRLGLDKYGQKRLPTK